MQWVKSGSRDGLHNLFHQLDVLQAWRDKIPFPPLWVEIGNTDLCNQKCFYCYPREKSNRGNSISKALLLQTIHELADAGVKCCEFQGAGEPLVNKATVDALVLGKQKDMDMCLVTNGVLLTKETLHKIEPCLSYLRISALAHNANYYDRLHRSGTSHYNIVIDALKNAIRIRNSENLETVVVVTYVIFDFNIAYMVETAKIMKDIGVDVFAIKPFVTFDPLFKSKPFYLEYADKFEETKDLENEDFKVYLNEERIAEFTSEKRSLNYDKCYGVEFETYISEEAKIYPCAFCRGQEQYCFGNLEKNSFEEIWYGDEKKHILQRFYGEMDLKMCSNFCCKQHSINEILYEMANPPRHKNVL